MVSGNISVGDKVRVVRNDVNAPKYVWNGSWLGQRLQEGETVIVTAIVMGKFVHKPNVMQKAILFTVPGFSVVSYDVPTKIWSDCAYLPFDCIELYAQNICNPLPPPPKLLELVADPHKCYCPTQTLVQTGCQCGGT